MKNLKISIIVLFLMLKISFGEKKALLIGINDYPYAPSQYKLYGCVNDVNIMKDILIKRYNFSDKDIKILLNKDATRQNIINHINDWLIKESKKGDLVILYYSGHGTQVMPDYNNDEIDGKDEVICPYDIVPNIGANIIIDDEMGVLLRKLEGREVVVIFDCCYSGGLYRGIGETEIIQMERTPSYRIRYLPPITNYTPTIHIRNIPTQDDIPSDVVFISASKEFEPALEIKEPEGWIGGFTKCLSEILLKEEKVTYEQLYEKVKKYIKSPPLNLPQTPQLFSKTEKIKQLVFHYKIDQQEPASQVIPPKPIPDKPLDTNEKIKEEILFLTIENFKGATTSQMENIKNQLKKLTYIKVVQPEEYFDILLRGEINKDKIQIRVVNRIGDAIHIKEVKELNEILENLKPTLEYFYIVKKLVYLKNPKKTFKVKVWVTDENRDDFKIGELVSFNFTSEKNCYILMINLDSSGNFDVICPNKYYPETKKYEGGKIYTIPDQEMKKNFLLQFQEPAGEETIKIIATTEPIDLKKIGLDKFKTIFEEEKTEKIPLVRKIRPIQAMEEVLKKIEWSEDTITIRSHK